MQISESLGLRQSLLNALKPKQSKLTFAMTSQKIDQLTLESTLDESIVKDSLAKFRSFLRERDDNDEDDPEVKLDSEQELDFVLRLRDIGQKTPESCPTGFYQTLAEDFFSSRKYKVNLRNATTRAALERDLKAPDGNKVNVTLQKSIFL